MHPPSGSPLTVRPTEPADLRRASDVIRVALLTTPCTDDEWATYGTSWAPEHMDSVSAWDDHRLVGHAGGYHLSTIVPGGGSVATCGVTRVGVLPTDTRRGVLTLLMRALLERARDSGRALASLRASEGVIYRRFGFGVAGTGVSIDVDTRRARPIANPAPGSFRLIDPAEFHEIVPALYERVALRPGVITRPTWMWNRYAEDFLGRKGAEHVVVHTDPDGIDDGFAHYSVRSTDGPGTHMNGTGQILDLWGATPRVELALWSFLVELDLVRSFGVDERAVDDVITMGAADPRAVATRARYDEQWIRVLDVDRFLTTRTFGADTSVVIEVTDPWFADNNGTWRVGGDGASRTDAAPDLRTDIVGLSSASMGSTPWWALEAVGQVNACAPDAVARADALFAHRPMTFCGSHF